MFTYLVILIDSINNKLQQPEAAAGVLDYAMQHHRTDIVSTKLPLFYCSDFFYNNEEKEKK